MVFCYQTTEVGVIYTFRSMALLKSIFVHPGRQLELWVSGASMTGSIDLTC